MKRTLLISLIIFILFVITTVVSEPKYINVKTSVYGKSETKTIEGIIIKDYGFYSKKYSFQHSENTKHISVTPKDIFEQKWHSPNHILKIKWLQIAGGFIASLVNVLFFTWLFKKEDKKNNV